MNCGSLSVITEIWVHPKYCIRVTIAGASGSSEGTVLNKLAYADLSLSTTEVEVEEICRQNRTSNHQLSGKVP